MWMWMPDVRSWFLYCYVPQKGPCGGPLRSEASFMRRTLSTWRTGTLLCLALARGSLTGDPAVTLQARAGARSIWCDVALTEAKYARCQASRWGVAPHLLALRVPPGPAPWLPLSRSLTWESRTSLLGFKTPVLIGSQGLPRWTP